jgi:molybdenum cofactor synthesis domain-containing protein
MVNQASTSPTAAMLVIGNEILNGRTRDANMHWIAGELVQRGIRLAEVRIVADVHEEIIDAVNALKRRYDMVFTSGGIGPTHDDITAAAIAEAVGQPLETHPEAEAILHDYYAPADRTKERMKMAKTPRGAALIPNAISAAPGFVVENIYVMAGVPKIFQSMFSAIAHTLNGGPPILSDSVMLHCPESTIAKRLSEIQDHHPTVEIGSYPFVKQGKFGTRIVFTATDNEARNAAREKLLEHLKAQNILHEVE